MIHLKTDEEVAIMKEGGIKLKKVAEELLPKIKPGVVTEEIDHETEKLILKQGAVPSFKTVKGYRWSTCLPINEQVVHTPPSNRIIQEGDVITVDLGVLYKGLHVDWATTFIVGEPKDKRHLYFLEAGKRALRKAIDKATSGRHLGEISETIQKEVESSGFFILKELTGHGIGRELHEDPYVPGYLDRPVKKTALIQPGLVIAIEVIYSVGTEEIAYESGNDWSIRTRDKSLSACFEETVAIAQQKSFILT